MADSVAAIAGDVFKEYVIAPVKRGFGYMVSSKRFADGLREEVRKLVFEDQRVNVLAEEAQNNVRDFYEAFTTWKASAGKALEEAQELLKAFDEESKTCCYGTLPDPKCRYQFSMKAECKIEVVKQLAQEGSRFRVLNDISFIVPARGNVAAPNRTRGEGRDIVQSTTATVSAPSASTSMKLRDDGVFESRAQIILGIKAALADKSTWVVGVHGMGGVGKSTLLREVESRISAEKSFDWVAKANVTENPDIKNIQGEIADAMGLTSIKDKETISGRAQLLHGRLKEEENKNKKVLIILDDLWRGLDLESVGIPCGHNNKVIGCKLLLTSRDRGVLKSEMGCDKDFPLRMLEQEEARRLFEKLVGEKVNDDDFKALVEEALRICAGLPFLIVNMAKQFNENASLPECRDAINQMEGCTNKGISAKINKLLELSYNKLESEDAKSLLHLCAAYAVSEPSFENLMRYAFGLGIFQKGSTMEMARDRLTALISVLRSSSLLLDDGGANGFKIHDLVRDFVAQFILRDHPLLVLKDQEKWETNLPKDKLERCRAICFPYIVMKELPTELDCPELQTFLFLTNSRSLEVPNSLFYSTRELMVLNLTGIRLTCSPSPFQFLKNLHTLCLEDCSLDNVAMLGELKGLQILSFLNSNIDRLPKEIGQLVELRLLDLNDCSQLEIIEPGVLRSLVKLEELYMENSFYQWSAVEQTPPTNVSLIELKHMKNLHTLHLFIPIPSVLPEDLNLEKLTKYRIRVGDMWTYTSYEGSSALKVKLDSTSNILRKECIQSILGKTDNLILDGLNETEQSICVLSQKGFSKLKHLRVDNSPSIHYILQSPSYTDFKRLESLILENLINLEKLLPDHISFKSFNALKVVRVVGCHKMKLLFPLFSVRELPNLEEIQVSNCKLMEGIAEVDDYGKVELRNLHKLTLFKLPNIKNFLYAKSPHSSSTSDDQVGTEIAFFNGQQVSIPSLESLTMGGLPNLTQIWRDESPLELSNLQSLQVMQCKSLSKVISSRSLVKLHKLCTLSINNCDLVHEIFYLDEPRANEDVEILSELTTLEVDGLSSLRHIWNKNPSGIASFRNLKEFKVHNCPNLMFIFFPSMVKSLAQLRDLKVYNCKKMEVIITEEEGLESDTLALVFSMLTNLYLKYLKSLRCFSHKKGSRRARSQDRLKPCSIALFNQEVTFPNLERLYIIDLDNIEMIWGNQVAADFFPKLELLYVYRCNKLVTVIPSFILGGLLCLESLNVLECGSLEVVFELQSPDPLDGHPVVFALKELTISKLPKLKFVWNEEVHCQVKFQRLRSVNISKCESLTLLFPASVARDLLELEELKIDGCGIIKVIEKEELAPKFVFPKLISLKLKHLTELKCIYTGTHALHWPALKILEVHGCHKVEMLASQPENETSLHKRSLFLIEKGAFPMLQELKLDLSEQMEIWSEHFHDAQFFCKLRVLELRRLSKEYAVSASRFVESLTNLEELTICESYLEESTSNVEAVECPSEELKVVLSFSRYAQHLTTLIVSCCDGLLSIFTSTIAGNLVALIKLRISNCRMLTEVISDDGSNEGHVVAFNQLKCMELDELIKLRCFGSGGDILIFPLLEEVIVTRCPNMKFFFEGSIEASKLERVKVSTETWLWNENLNITIQTMSEEMVTIARATFIRLLDFPELVGKWHIELNPIKPSWQLQSLIVDKCPSFVNAIPSKSMHVLEKLKLLQVCDCQLLEEIFNLEGLETVESTRVLPNLQCLKMINLPSLRRLWNKNLQGTICFNYLSDLTLYKCGDLRCAFDPSMARCLQNLREMEIKACGQMEGVIAEGEEEGSVAEKISFPRLWSIRLECLPKLATFLSGKNHLLDCPGMMSFTIAHCPNMRSLTRQTEMDIDDGTSCLLTPQVQFPGLMWMVLSHMDNLSNIWTNCPQENLSFDYLRGVEVRNCTKLENLFPYWVATSLTLLEKLLVESCGIEKIVANEDDTPYSNPAQVPFPKLTSLVLHDMPRLKSFYRNLRTLHWPFLEELRVTHCDQVNISSFGASMNKCTKRNDQQDLSDQAHSSFERDFPNLERLLLVDKDIQMIQDGKFPDDIFGKPKALTLACFHDEKTVFPLGFLLKRFQNLRSLEVFCCCFEDLFPNEGLVDEEKYRVLENLRELKLSKLHNLKCVWREDYSMEKILQGIKTFEIEDCPGLMTIFPSMMSFRNLMKLVVKNSSGLIHLVTTSAITNLVHLTDMTIIGCEKLKEVVTDVGNGEGKVISLGKLTWLTLQNLPSLVCFSSGTSCSFRFPSLFSIKVEECPQMKFFSKGSLSMSKPHFVTLFQYKWEGHWEGDLNTTIQKLSA